MTKKTHSESYTNSLDRFNINREYSKAYAAPHEQINYESTSTERRYNFIHSLKDSKTLLIDICSYFLDLLEIISFYRLQLVSFNFFGYIDKIDIGIETISIITSFSYYYEYVATFIFSLIALIAIIFVSFNYCKKRELVGLKYKFLFILLGSILMYGSSYSVNKFIDLAAYIYNRLLPQDAESSRIILGFLLLGMSIYSIYEIMKAYKRIEKKSLGKMNPVYIIYMIGIVVSLIASALTFNFVVIPSYAKYITIFYSYFASS